MADWSLGPEGAEQAKVMAGGGLGSLFTVYLRRPRSLFHGVTKFGLGFASSWIFTPDVALTTGWREPTVAALVGLTAAAIAQGILVAAENFDAASLLKRRSE